MLSRNRSREGAQFRAEMRHRELLPILLAGLLFLITVGVSSAESWDEAVANAKKEGELVVVLGGAASRTYRPIFKIFEELFFYSKLSACQQNSCFSLCLNFLN